MQCTFSDKSCFSAHSQYSLVNCHLNFHLKILVTLFALQISMVISAAFENYSIMSYKNSIGRRKDGFLNGEEFIVLFCCGSDSWLFATSFTNFPQHKIAVYNPSTRSSSNEGSISSLHFRDTWLLNRTRRINHHTIMNVAGGRRVERWS